MTRCDFSDVIGVILINVKTYVNLTSGYPCENIYLWEHMLDCEIYI